ncbi:MAG: hypothetical protein HKN90_04410 [Flavobacteriaceae bacterium]|nr:hypothetical protein [Flavobacteriaceae bacterium]
MKKLSIIFFVAFFGFTICNSFAQEKKSKATENLEIAAKDDFKKNKRIKIELEKLPNAVLVSLRDSYAKHFVIKAFKANKQGDVYFVELRKSRTVFTVAVDNNGRVLREIRDTKMTVQNTLANKN